ncbi:LacI family DNA-binding transcriptional regulator [Primorskyibacter flagellatus]|nr:substrate-binding domain-containing protein [Primorskyibacter flagellatus]
MNLKTLSEHLGLSQTTVSRALNGYPEVSEKTRQRVLESARKLNYSPNARAKGLATGKSMAIGHVIARSSRHEMVNPVFGDYTAGAGESYSAAGYDMLISLVDDDNEEQFYRAIKSKGNVDGLIVHGPKMEDTRIDLLSSLGLPFLSHGRASNVTRNYAWLDVNNCRAFQRATEFLLDLGHRRIALLNGLEFLDFAHRRRQGYIKALAGRGLEPEPALMRSDEMTEIYGYRETRAMLEADDPPTAVLCSSIISAIGVRRALSDAGLTMGRDVSVITYDDDLSYMSNGQEVPIFTATRSSVREAGRLSAQMLLDMIRNPGLPLPTHLMEADLIIGQSTGPAPNHT